MNRTNIEHGLYMLAVQAVGMLACFLLSLPLLDGAVVGYALVMGVFFHREYAQAEDIAVRKTGMTRTQLQLWHVIKHMTLDGYLDWFVPAVFGSGAIWFSSI